MCTRATESEAPTKGQLTCAHLITPTDCAARNLDDSLPRDCAATAEAAAQLHGSAEERLEITRRSIVAFRSFADSMCFRAPEVMPTNYGIASWLRKACDEVLLKIGGDAPC